jgi:hypothetical protein
MDYSETFNTMFAYLGDEECLAGTTDIAPVTQDPAVLLAATLRIEPFVRDSDWDGLRQYFTTQFGENATPLIKISNLLEANTHSEEDRHECLDICSETCGDIWEAIHAMVEANIGEE